MPDRLKSVLLVGLSLGLAAVLLWLSLRGADMGAVAAALRDASWGWLLPMAAMGVASVALRAWRWRLLTDALPAAGVRPGVPLLFWATSLGYLVNYVLPRAGEVGRAATVAARSGVAFPAVVGTVVAERVLDVGSLAVALVVVAVGYGDRVGFVTEGIGRTVAGVLGSVPVLVLVGGIVLVGLAGLFVLRWMRRGAAGRLAGLVASFRDGLATVARTRRPVALVVSTVALWGTYAVMADLPLRLLRLSGTYGLSLADAFAVMAVGAVGMALPSPGGAGSYHYATVQALTQLFAVDASAAATYALLAHAAQLMLYAGMGGLALVVLGTSLRALRAGSPEAETP